MLRTVLAVLLAVSLLGVSAPVVDSARIDHANRGVETALQRLDTAAVELLEHNDPVTVGRDGARRYHQITLPAGSWGTAQLDRFEIPPPNSHGRLVWRVAGGTRSSFRPSVPIVSRGGLTLRDGGRQRLVLTLRVRDGRQVVSVSRPDV